MAMPSAYAPADKNSSCSCSSFGVRLQRGTAQPRQQLALAARSNGTHAQRMAWRARLMGEKPSEGMPSTRRYEASVAAGKISGAMASPCAASDAVKAPHQGFAAASMDVTAAEPSACSRFAYAAEFAKL